MYDLPELREETDAFWSRILSDLPGDLAVKFERPATTAAIQELAA